VSDLSVVLTHAEAREERTVTTGTKAWELYADDPAVIAARVGGVLRDLAYELQDGDEVEPVAIDSSDGRDILRHSTAHVMAQAVQQIWSEAKLGIGPPVENGFYYDFDVDTPFVPEDLEKIETAMRKIIKEGQRFSRRPVADADALAELKDEPYKLELIGLKGGLDQVDQRDVAEVAATASSPGRTSAAARTCRPPSASRRSS
jgi:threonyl-tRNA synthetase